MSIHPLTQRTAHRDRSRADGEPGTLIHQANDRLILTEGTAHRWLVAHSIAVLRVSLGLVFLGFGALKFFPGVSPAAELALTTTHLLTFGLVGDVVPYSVGLILVATLECTIGLLMITGLLKRLNVYLLLVQLAGIMSPLILLPGRLFSGPHHAPTLEGQYVLKDVVLVAAAMVIATAFRGARIRYPDRTVTCDEPTPSDAVRDRLRDRTSRR